MAQNKLKLNADKTLLSKRGSVKWLKNIFPILILSRNVTHAHSTRNIGVICRTTEMSENIFLSLLLSHSWFTSSVCCKKTTIVLITSSLDNYNSFVTVLLLMISQNIAKFRTVKVCYTFLSLYVSFEVCIGVLAVIVSLILQIGTVTTDNVIIGR